MAGRVVFSAFRQLVGALVVTSARVRGIRVTETLDALRVRLTIDCSLLP